VKGPVDGVFVTDKFVEPPRQIADEVALIVLVNPVTVKVVVSESVHEPNVTVMINVYVPAAVTETFVDCDVGEAIVIPPGPEPAQLYVAPEIGAKDVHPIVVLNAHCVTFDPA
jgi:hypothetical protein